MKQVKYKKIDITNPVGIEELNAELKDLETSSTSVEKVQMIHADTRFVYVFIVWNE